MHFFSVNNRSQLKHVGDFPSEEQALRWLTAQPEEPTETEDDVVMYISIDDVRRLVQEFLLFCMGKLITPDSHFGIKTEPSSNGRRVTYLGDFPDARVAQDVITDQHVATTLAELHGTSPGDYLDLAWVVSTNDFRQWQSCTEGVVGRKLWETN